MRIKLLVATTDADYAGHLSDNVSEYHAGAIDVNVCLSAERLHEVLSAQKFDVALIQPSLAKDADLRCIHLPMLLWEEDDDDADTPVTLKKIRKDQRISSITADVLEHYAKVSTDNRGSEPEKANITAVWSPAGGVGKTTVALAYASRKASEGKLVLYLNLEPFSSVPVYFSEAGKSISAIFEMLDNNEGNVKVFIRGVMRQDSGSGVYFLCGPENFDDMNILSAGNTASLISACADVTEELIIDMSCVCDERNRQILDHANRLLLITDSTVTAQTKLTQFASQHNVFQQVREKTVLVANKGVSVSRSLIEAVVRLPLVHTADAGAVYTTLSRNWAEA